MATGAGSRGERAQWVMPALVLLAGIAATAIAGWQLSRMLAVKAEERFRYAVLQMHDAIEDRIDTYVALLRGGAGLFAAARVDRAEFRAYIERLLIDEQYPGVLGIGFSRRVTPEEVPTVEAAMRADGFGGFRIWPPGPRPDYQTIVFLEPLDRRNRAALGFDMSTEPVRRAAMDAARDDGAARASGPVELVQEIDSEKQPGFLIYVPVYRGGSIPATVAERRESLAGFVYAPFRAGDLFKSIFPPDRPLEAEFAVYAGEPGDGTLLYRSPDMPAAGGVERIARLAVAGREWTVVYRPSALLRADATGGLVPLALAIGFVTTLLLTLAAWAQARAAARAMALTRELTQANRALEARVAELNEARARAEDLAQRKTVLLREVNHRVGNSLQLVSSLAGMQRAVIRDPVARDVLLETQMRIAAIGQVHRRLYTSDDIQFVRMDEYLRTLVEEIRRSMTEAGRAHAIEVTAEPVQIETDKAVSVGVIVNELVTNACKYAYPDNGTGPIRVRFARAGEGTVALTVEDEGIGMTAGAAPRGTGVGQRIVEAMAANLRSLVEIDPDHAGTRVTVSFAV